MLTSPGRPEEDDVIACGDEIQGAEVGDGVAFEATGVVEVEFLQRFSGWESGSPDAALPAVGFSRGDFTLQTRREVFLVSPVLGSGTLGQPAHGLTQGGCLQRSGEVGQLGGQIATRRGGGFGGGHQAAPPSRSTPNTAS